MELVRGIKITDYCDQANLSTKERLNLFIKVCQAIQHAHQKGDLTEKQVAGPSSSAYKGVGFGPAGGASTV